MGALNAEEGIFHYYIFQKKLQLYLSGGKYKKDNKKIKDGYILNPNWVSNWKKSIHYADIENYLKNKGVKSYKIDKSIEGKVYNYIRKFINENYYYANYFKCKNNQYLQVSEKIMTQKYLQTMVSNKIYYSININAKYKYNAEKIQYIFKEQMMILIFPYYKIIKMIISNLKPFSEQNKIVNLTFIFNSIDYYESYIKQFKEQTSYQILAFIVTNDIFNKSRHQFTSKQKLILEIINEEEYISKKKQIHLQNNIKAPLEINYSLIQRPSFRGLDNVGATCYMNATIQCLANIRPVTESLLKPNKYKEIYNNPDLCRLTLEYCQVLIGLFCNDSNTGSYRPEEFKITIGELNSLFQGVQANDSKDLIIFLLETINIELVKLRNKKNNIKENENESTTRIDPTNETSVFNEFQKDFSKTHYSTVGYNLCGIQKNIFTCQFCKSTSYNFNIFNFLIFGLETISNYFNLSNNNTQLPIITFDHCFNYMCKKEPFDQTYCQNCKQTGKSIYQEGIYVMPNYLIIILNRGKGNIFNCKVVIPESFASINYEEKVKNNIFELVGIVSHFGESGMGGHFIAFCKHNIDQKWRCYNDSIVVECQNDYLNKGTPYILFYKKNSVNNSQNNNFLNNNNPNLIFNTNIQHVNNINNQQQLSMNINNNNNNINNNINNQQQQNMNMNNCFNNGLNNNINLNQNMLMINNNNIPQMNNNFQGNPNFNCNCNQNNFGNGMNMSMNVNMNMFNQNMIMNNNNSFQPNMMNMNANMQNN